MSSRPSRGAARLAAILDALPDALLLVNANGTVVNANCIALDVFETPGTALIGRGLLDLLPAFDSKRIPGSMRRPDEHIEQRQPPTRMVARRTDGNEFPVEVTSTNLEDGRTTYESSFEAAYADHGGYSGNELLMLVVRDLTGTLDTEAELARQQRQTEMILRAAAEGVVGTDTEGRVVLVNPSAAQILGYRASDLGGQALHPLVHHTRGDGSPLPYEETPLADTLRSGRKHRVRGQVLWSKHGERVPVDMTTAPVRDGEQLVGAVLTFTDRRRMDSLEARHAQLLSVVDDALRGPLEELRNELTGLAADSAGQLWPEANQVLHHLSAGYARMTTLIDNVVRYQRLDAGREKLDRKQVSLDSVIAAGVESAVDLIGPGRAQFAVHAPPIQAEVDADRLALAIAHLVADVAGVSVTGHGPSGAGLSGSTIVVAAARRGGGDQGEETTQKAVVRIEVRGPHAGGSPVHVPIARGVVRLHGGVLQTHDVPGATGGSAYVLEVPVGEVSDLPLPGAELELSRPGTGEVSDTESGADGMTADGVTPANETTVMPLPEQPPRGTPRAHALPAGDQQPRPVSAFALPPGPTAGPGNDQGPDVPSGAVPLPPGPMSGQGDALPAGVVPEPRTEAVPPAPAGRRARRTLSPVEEHDVQSPEQSAPSPDVLAPADDSEVRPEGVDSVTDGRGVPLADDARYGDDQIPPQAQPGTGRRGRRAKPPAEEAHGQAPAGSAERAPFALPPGADDAADTAEPAGQHGQHNDQTQAGQQDRPTGRRRKPSTPDTAPEAASPPEATPRLPEPSPSPQATEQPGDQLPRVEDMDPRAAGHMVVARSPILGGAVPPSTEQPRAKPLPMPGGNPPSDHSGAVSVRTLGQGRPYAAQVQARADAQAADARAAAEAETAEAGAGPRQPAPFPSPHGQPGSQPTPPGSQPGSPEPTPGEGRPQHTPPGGTGRRRKLATPPEQGRSTGPAAAPSSREQSSGPDRRAGQFGRGPHPHGQLTHGEHPHGQHASGQHELASPTPQPGRPQHPRQSPQRPQQPQLPGAVQPAPQAGQPTRDGAALPAGQTSRQLGTGSMAGRQAGRQFTVSAPDAEADEGPEPLDGPGGATEVTHPGAVTPARPIDVDDELPPEPLDNPRRLLVWPEPDASTRQALTERGYRPVLVHSREEVDAQIAAYPAALFVDPLAGPITRTALQSLRQAAVTAEVPVLVTAGLGQASREAAYGADPAVLLKALAPRDSGQHPSRVLLVEGDQTIARAFAATLERRGMQVAHAASDSDATNLAAQIRPNLVVMDLAQIRRRRAGVIDWLRVHGLLTRTPFVVYTSAGMDQDQLAQLAAGETVLFLAERSTNPDVQSRLVDLLTKIDAR